jgi:hypothetical protein
MKTINEKKALEVKIAFLKSKQASDYLNLILQYHDTVNSLKPINLIKNSIVEVITTPNLKSNLINGALSLGSTYLAKNYLNTTSKNPIKNVLGKVLKFAFKNFIGNKS